MEGKCEETEYDVFRDSPLRHCGYADEVGEAFRAVVPRSVVYAGYGVSLLYTLGDITDKALRCKHQQDSFEAVTEQIIDTVLWQCTASFIIPPLLVNRTAAVARWAFRTMPGFRVAAGQALGTAKARVARWTPVAAGLSIIPFLPGTVDPFVDRAMDKWVRPWLQGKSRSFISPTAAPPPGSEPEQHHRS